MLDVISNKNVAETVFEYLKQEILHGTLSPGQRLVEREYADMMQVSRTPVREAIRLLEAEGFVRKLPRRGVVVAQTLSREELIQLYTIRISLEGTGVRWAVEKGDEKEIGLLEKYLDMFELHRQNRDQAGLVATNRMFHSQIVAMSHCATLVQLYSMLHEKIQMAMNVGHAIRYVDVTGDHRIIWEAIRQRDADLAETTLKRHISQARDRLVSGM